MSTWTPTSWICRMAIRTTRIRRCRAIRTPPVFRATRECWAPKMSYGEVKRRDVNALFSGFEHKLPSREVQEFSCRWSFAANEAQRALLSQPFNEVERLGDTAI
eukprot:symbB.v1.2.015641.t1/scaffold1142.1/size245703/10